MQDPRGKRVEENTFYICNGSMEGARCSGGRRGGEVESQGAKAAADVRVLCFAAACSLSLSLSTAVAPSSPPPPPLGMPRGRQSVRLLLAPSRVCRLCGACVSRPTSALGVTRLRLPHACLTSRLLRARGNKQRESTPH
jgi:hypothetical protein